MKKAHKKDWHNLAVGLSGALGITILGILMVAAVARLA